VDTDWAIHYLHGHTGIIARLDELQTEGLELSVVSLAELYEGIHASRDPQGNEQGRGQRASKCPISRRIVTIPQLPLQGSQRFRSWGSQWGDEPAFARQV
jgi:hypothetical protein